MESNRWERFAAGSGLAFVVALVLAVGVLLPPSMSPEAAVPGSIGLMIAIMVGERFFRLSLFCFLFFLGALWSALRRADERTSWLTAIGLATGTAAVVLLLGRVTLDGVILHAASCVGRGGAFACELWPGDSLGKELAAVLNTLGWKFTVASSIPLAVFLATTAIAARRTEVLPRWLARAAGVLAGAFLVASIPEFFVFLVYPFFLVWVAVASVHLVRAASRSHSAPSGAAAASRPSAVS